MKKKLKRWIILVLRMPYLCRDYVFCRWYRLPWRADWLFQGLPVVSISRYASVRIGKRFVACSQARHNSIGVSQSVRISVSSKATLSVGDDVGISGCSILADEHVEIGNHVLIGSGCLIMDSDSHPLRAEDRKPYAKCVTRPVRIEDDVFIGARSIILKGVTVGRGSVVGAGSVVVKSVPPWSVCAGNPAKVVKTLSPPVTQ